eukprot:CAMPEP_0171182296 /NCGR_PEP_ID=MMETSP0790-20130122/14695_1 /TAXON_ID=2925 /ORGANISM="Alexandrium catenella, Strain OF101" /LENGTH=249 /DNA_ID=CAMNT_0011647247 /DNA_START=57 /DNA_END=806 /DNA_ORIENTATION=-
MAARGQRQKHCWSPLRDVPGEARAAGPLAQLRGSVFHGGLRLLCRHRAPRGGSRGGEDVPHRSTSGVLVLPMQGALRVKEQQMYGIQSSLGAFAYDERWRINLLYDGDCHVCKMQVQFLTKRMDENPEFAGIIRLTNLADPLYDAEACGGVAFEDGMRHIHAVTRDGVVITGVQVFRHVYRTVGMEWVYTLTSLPFLGPLFDSLYDLWAENRLQLTGRADVLERVHEHQKMIEELSEMECETECEIDWE